MAQAPPGEYQRKNKAWSSSQMASMNSSASRSSAAARGVGGGLLLGFSTCAVDGAAGVSYIAAQHRLRAVHCKAGKMNWHFEPMAGAQYGNTDVITMDVLDELQPMIWKFVQNYIGGSNVSDVLTWIHNPCALDSDGKPTALPGVTAMTIVVATTPES